MRRCILLLLLFCLLPMAGCSKDRVYGGLYEGVRTRNELGTTPSERLRQPDSPNYQQYDRQRQEKIDRDIDRSLGK